MKQILTFVFLMFFAFGHSQKLVEGIGKFKIHKTTISIIDSLTQEFGTIGAIRFSRDETYAGATPTANIYEVFCDTNNMDYIDGSPIYSMALPKSRVFYISSYTIANIEIQNIHLYFYKDTLIDFESDGSTEINDALDLKYGEAKSDVKEKEVKCTYTYTGTDVTYKDMTYTKTWPGNHCTCSSLLHKYYDTDCKPQYLSIFSVSDDHLMNKMHDYNREARKRYESRVKAEKTKKLSDF